MSNTKTPETVREFMLKKFPTNEYMDCPVPKEYWPIIQEYSAQQNRAYVEALKWTLEFIDAIPKDIQLPIMPGFDRDYVNSLIQNEGK